MKKTFFLILILAFLMTSGVFAQFRLDMGLKIPVKMGVHFSDLSSGEDTSVDILDKYTFLVPEVTGSYQVSLGPVNMGAGIQLYTFILESIAWPIVFAEIDLSPIVINAKIGGFGFLVFGLYNDGVTGNVLIPDINAAFKLGKSLRIGLGVMGFTGKEFNSDAVPYLIYLSGSLSMLF